MHCETSPFLTSYFEICLQSRSIEAQEGCEHATVMMTTNLQQQFFATIGACTNISKWIDAVGRFFHRIKLYF